MKRIFSFILFYVLMWNNLHSQVFQVDTLLYNGDVNKYINMVILGDGYMASEQADFITDATNLTNNLFSQPPWANYKNYFNIIAVKVVSAQSGTRHNNTASDCSTASPLVPLSYPHTYLGCRFDSYGIHRLVSPDSVANIANTLITNFPEYDQVLIVANTPYYGGSGGNYATATIDTSSGEIVVHELGHSFAGLADEYYAGDNYAAEKPNMTQEFDPAMVKWKNWVGTNGVGVFQHCCGGNSAQWYKPSTNSCKMEVLGQPYCSVCSEAIVETIHSLVNPIIAYSPQSLNINTSNPLLNFELTDVIKPIPNTLHSEWKLGAQLLAQNTDSVQVNQDVLTNGIHTLTVAVTDTTSLVRVDNHSTLHVSTVTWSINKTYTGIDVLSEQNKIDCVLFPNPTAGILNFVITLEEKCTISFFVVDSKGQMVQNPKMLANKNSFSEIIDMSDLPAGIYSVVVDFNNNRYSQQFIKQ